MSDKQRVSVYALTDGDRFVISDKQVMAVFSNQDGRHMFFPLRCFKKPMWYKPWTWFRHYYEIEYVEIERLRRKE